MKGQSMSVKAYTVSQQTCCIPTLDNCGRCKERHNCLILREQLAFYNRLGISQIDDNINPDSLVNIRYLWQDSIRTKKYDPSWNYTEDNTRAYTHSIHPYPAMMIPQVAGRLIDMYAKSKTVVLDPFCGSGSVLVEAFIKGYNSYGIDINPLSLLISRVKTTPINYNQEVIEDKINRVGRHGVVIFDRLGARSTVHETARRNMVKLIQIRHNQPLVELERYLTPLVNIKLKQIPQDENKLKNLLRKLPDEFFMFERKSDS